MVRTSRAGSAAVVIGCLLGGLGGLVVAALSVGTVLEMSGVAPAPVDPDVLADPGFLPSVQYLALPMVLDALGGVVAFLLALAAAAGSGAARTALLVWAGLIALRMTLVAVELAAWALAPQSGGLVSLGTWTTLLLPLLAVAALPFLGSPASRDWFRRSTLAA